MWTFAINVREWERKRERMRKSESERKRKRERTEESEITLKNKRSRKRISEDPMHYRSTQREITARTHAKGQIRVRKLKRKNICDTEI